MECQECGSWTHVRWLVGATCLACYWHLATDGGEDYVEALAAALDKWHKTPVSSCRVVIEEDVLDALDALECLDYLAHYHRSSP